jgi:predicted nucleotidyltransferase
VTAAHYLNQTKEVFAWLFDTETMNQVISGYVSDVKSAMPIDRVFLFGSYAKGNATEYSDADICFFLGSFGGKCRVDVIAELARRRWWPRRFTALKGV